MLSCGLFGGDGIDPVGVVLSTVGLLLAILLLDLVPAFIRDLLLKEGKISKAFPVAPVRVARLLEGMLEEMDVAFRREGPVDEPGIDVGEFEAAFRTEADGTVILVEDAGASTVVHVGQRRRPGEGGSLDGFAGAVDRLLEGAGG